MAGVQKCAPAFLLIEGINAIMMPEWITAVSTVIYVVATIFIVVSNKKMANATHKQVMELQRQFDQQNRPYICIRFESVRSGLLCLSVENTGSLPAHNVQVSVNDDFVQRVSNSVLKELLQKFAGSMFYLSPGQKLYCGLGYRSEFRNLEEQALIMDVSYLGNESCYKDHIEIDLSGYEWAIFYSSPFNDISDKMTDISNSLSHSERHIENIVHILKPMN
ncbi:MAG: hypothetical protein ABFD49_09375 [Armatimonadota bacterium]|nr:hypothetical protein [bacterium]